MKTVTMNERTYTKVSGSVNKIKIVHAPAKKVNTQYTQRQETPDTAMKPLTVGPSEGPANGARVKNPRAFPRVLASHMSDMSALAKMLEATFDDIFSN